MQVEAAAFKSALTRLAAGVAVVTLRDPRAADGAPADLAWHGMTATAFCSVSLDPPLVLVCVRKASATHEWVVRAGGFAINVLAADQVSVSNRFAGRWQEGSSRWADLDLRAAPVTGAPWLGGALAWLDCTLHATYDGGDHSIFVGHVRAAEVTGEATSPLLYFSGGYRGIGEST